MNRIDKSLPAAVQWDMLERSIEGLSSGMWGRKFKRARAELASAARRQWPVLRNGPLAVGLALLGLATVALITALFDRVASTIVPADPPPEKRADPEPRPASKGGAGDAAARASIAIEGLSYLPNRWFQMPVRMEKGSLSSITGIDRLKGDCLGDCYPGVASKLRFFEYRYAGEYRVANTRAPLEPFCALPELGTIFSAFGRPGRGVAKRLGASLDGRGAARFIDGLQSVYDYSGDEEHDPRSHWSPDEQDIAGVMARFVLLGELPHVGPTDGNYEIWWRDAVAETAEGRAKQVLDALATPFSRTQFSALPVRLVARNEAQRAGTVFGTAVELIAYGEYADAISGGGDTTAVELPAAIPSAGTDRFDIEEALKRSRLEGGSIVIRHYYPAPVELAGGAVMRRELQLQNNVPGFLIWRAGLIGADETIAWGPERCHYVPWLALR